ncbi:UNVERIFIED_CONTAM: hypothetical protein HDU68_006522 [Siphonaria sp. JEL0065]|nr:hypothetical protein HDU68_006522 [Siphonaria sp. JEL0065]
MSPTIRVHSKYILFAIAVVFVICTGFLSTTAIGSDSIGTASSLATRKLRLDFDEANAWWKSAHDDPFQCHNKTSIKVSSTPPMTMYAYTPEDDRWVSGSLTSGIPSVFFEAPMRVLMLKALEEHPGAVILDIGANIGLHTVFFANAGYEVHAFEPYRATFSLLGCSVTKNNFHKVHLNNFGLGTSTNTTCITESFGNRGHATVQENTHCDPEQTIVVWTNTSKHTMIRVLAMKPVKEMFTLNPPAHVFSEFYAENMANVNVVPKEYMDLLFDIGYTIKIVSDVIQHGQIIERGSELYKELIVSGMVDIHAYLKN